MGTIPPCGPAGAGNGAWTRSGATSAHRFPGSGRDRGGGFAAPGDARRSIHASQFVRSNQRLISAFPRYKRSPADEVSQGRDGSEDANPVVPVGLTPARVPFVGEHSRPGLGHNPNSLREWFSVRSPASKIPSGHAVHLVRSVLAKRRV